MTRLEALQALLAKVEAGDKNTHIASDFHLAMGGREYHTASPDALAADRAYHGSFDAALALCGAVLPGWHWMKGYCVTGGGGQSVTVYLPAESDADWLVECATSDNPARAFLIAILKALITQEQDQ